MGKKNRAEKESRKAKEKAKEKARKLKAKEKAKEAKKLKAGKKAAKQAKLRDPARWKIKSKCCRSNPRCKSCPVVFKRLERAGAFEREDVDFAAELKLARRW